MTPDEFPPERACGCGLDRRLLLERSNRFLSVEGEAWVQASLPAAAPGGRRGFSAIARPISRSSILPGITHWQSPNFSDLLSLRSFTCRRSWAICCRRGLVCRACCGRPVRRARNLKHTCSTGWCRCLDFQKKFLSTSDRQRDSGHGFERVACVRCSPVGAGHSMRQQRDRVRREAGRLLLDARRSRS